MRNNEKSCCNCKHEGVPYNEKPCCYCRNTLKVSDPNFLIRPFLWENPDKETAESAPDNITIHAAICDELKDLYRRKNTDYGDSFHKTYLEEGLAMSRIRLTDKLERFKRLTRSGEQNVKDESVRDTLIDLANYAIMTIVEMEREK